uniref:Uncharacterized protein n=1 Tax=Chlamydomonas euryale TaxID=1486919 RepID=A0A7R9VM38_9CHLO
MFRPASHWARAERTHRAAPHRRGRAPQRGEQAALRSSWPAAHPLRSGGAGSAAPADATLRLLGAQCNALAADAQKAGPLDRPRGVAHAAGAASAQVLPTARTVVVG